MSDPRVSTGMGAVEACSEANNGMIMAGSGVAGDSVVSSVSSVTGGMPNNVNICSVCNAPSENFHLNYGVSSCLSCRAFFRRTVQKNNYPKLKCKSGGNCVMTEESRRGCRKCRFEACLRAGMQEGQVMNEDMKQVRFRRVFKKMEKELKEVGVTVDSNRKILLPPELEAAKTAEEEIIAKVKKKGRKEKPKDNTLKLTYKRNNSGSGSGVGVLAKVLPKSLAGVATSDFKIISVKNAGNDDWKPKEETIKTEVDYDQRSNDKTMMTKQDISSETEPAGLDDNLLLAYLNTDSEDLPAETAMRSLRELNNSLNLEEPEAANQKSMIIPKPGANSSQLTSCPQEVNAALEDLFCQNDISHQPLPGPAVVPRAKAVADYKILEIENILQSWNMALEENPFHCEFVTAFMYFLQFKEGMNKHMISEHLAILINIFHSFAKSQSAFCSLPLQDRELLLKQNSWMLATCILGHSFGSFAGIEQVMWLVAGQSKFVQNPPMNFLAPMSFRECNYKLNFFSHREALNQFDRSMLKVRQFNLACRWLGLLAYNCLYYIGPGMNHLFRDPERIVKYALDAQSLYLSAQGGSRSQGQNWPYLQQQQGMGEDWSALPDFLHLLQGTSQMLLAINWTSNSTTVALPIDLGFTQAEELALSIDFSKIENALDSTSFGQEIVEELAMANFDVPLSKGFMAKCGAIWQQRFLRILKSFSEFEALSNSNQILCVNQVTLPVFALITLWSEYMNSPAEQQEFSLGKSDKAFYRSKYQHCIESFSTMRPFTLESVNSASRLFDPTALKNFAVVKRLLKDLMVDRETFNLLILIAIFNPVVNLLEMSNQHQSVCSRMAQISHQYHSLLRKRSKAKQLLTGERLDQGFRQITELTQVMTAMCSTIPADQ